MTLATCDESLFWYWINERHSIYLRKKAGDSKPWSLDPIFQKYKFVNVFRRLDRTTHWLIQNFLEPHRDGDLSTLAFNICWFRMFNRWETGAALGWQDHWSKAEVLPVLEALRTPFTGAYIIHSEPGESKVDSITHVCEELRHLCFAGGALVTAAKEEGVVAVWRGLQQAKHVGPFMAYQMVLDMMYTPLLENAEDRFTWAYTGPGALRGLRRLYPGTTMRNSLDEMQFLRERQFMGIEAHVPPLDIHDIEFALCELDKYARVKNGEGKPRSGYPGVK